MATVFSVVSKYFRKIRMHLEKWREKTPKQKWQFIYDLGGKLSELVGVTVFTSMKINWFSFFPEVNIIIYLLLVSYTMCFYFDQGEYLRGLLPTCGIGIVFGCFIVQVQTLGPKRFKINNILNYGKYIYVDEDHTPKYNSVREKMVQRLIRHTIVVVVLILALSTIFGCTVFYLIMFEKIRITFYGLELPFFEKYSDIGFLVNMSLQCVMSALGIVAMVIVEIASCLMTNAVCAMPHLMHVEMEDLGVEVRANGMTLIANARLRNIFIKIQDFEKFAKEIIDVYYMRLFVGPALFTYSIAFSIFSQLLGGYPIGYAFAACNYILLLICCYLGEQLEQANDQIVDELYGMSWYLLPTSSQKGVLSAMHMIQHGKVLTMGPFAKLNMEAAADLTKSVYRFTMMVYRVLT